MSLSKIPFLREGMATDRTLGEMEARASEKRWILFQDTAGTTSTQTWYSR
jgi:hypothetical protein